MTRPWPRINGKGRNMLDIPPNYKPLDPGRVDTVDPVELHYWSVELRCTQAELMEVVSKVGDHVTAVREYLASRR